jgi:hypothetical protein
MAGILFNTVHSVLICRTLQATNNTGTCVVDKIAYDPLIHHKNHFIVGVHALRTLEEANATYAQIFSEYLTATAGTRFNPPITFDMVPLYSTGLYHAVDTKSVDFVFANSGLYSCIGIEWGIQGLATVVQAFNGKTYMCDM